jgi:hypothetical protein
MYPSHLKCFMAQTRRQDPIMMNDPANGDNQDAGDVASPAAVELDPKIQEAIGHALKAHYDDLVSAPIPDRLLVLLAELEAKEQGHGR